MKRYTHVITGFTIGVYTASSPLEAGVHGFIASIGSMIPDLDLRFKHRKLLHNIFVPVVVWLLLYIFLGYLKLTMLIDKSTLLSIGWISHVLLDALTIRGVYIAYPFSTRRFSLKLFKSDSLIGNAAISFIAILLLSLKVYGFLNQ
ncbi:MAG: metal-dependent hydrolase [Desulfurococcaceae archaeon]